MEVGPLLYKNLYKFAKNLHNVRSVHIFAIVFVGNKFSSHYRVILNYWCSHMNFYMQSTILWNMELDPLLHAHNRWNQVFFLFYLFKSSGIFATSLEINVSQHILSICVGEINPFEFHYIFYVFRVFLDIMKNGVRNLVALTPSIDILGFYVFTIKS